jgi:hypothetical protein
LLLAIAACTEDVGSPPNGPRIAFLFDGSLEDAEAVTAPALSGLELAAHEAGGIEIEPVNLALARGEVMALLRDLGEDRGVIAAVVAPWTAPPEGAIELLAQRGLPIVTLSWAWGPPVDGDGLWLSFAAGVVREAVMLLSGAAALRSGDAAICLAGDEHVTSRALLRTAAELGEAAGDPEVVSLGGAVRSPEARCGVLAWIGGAPAAARTLSAISGAPPVVGPSRLKTDEGLALTAKGVEVSTVCACADVSLSLDPSLQSFVHDIQAESGAPPGPFAVEAYDAGSFLIGRLRTGADDREAIRTALAELSDLIGLSGSYAFEPDGSRTAESLPDGSWRAAGSRWLPEPARGVVPASPA